MERESGIKLIAYNLWQEGNCPHGLDREHWMQAELIWEGQQKPQAPIVRKKTKVEINGKKTKKNTI